MDRQFDELMSGSLEEFMVEAGLIKTPRLQLNLREKIDTLISVGYDVVDRDPITMFNGGRKLVWNGVVFVEHTLELEPKENATRPYERVGGDNFIDDGVLVL